MELAFYDKQVYITYFGLSKVYRDPKTHVHIGCGGDCDDILTDTAIYASLNNHWGIKQTHCDDLESLAYMLIYFLCSSLPWSHVKTLTKKVCHMIMQMKLDTPNFWADCPVNSLYFSTTLMFWALRTNLTTTSYASSSVIFGYMKDINMIRFLTGAHC